MHVNIADYGEDPKQFSYSKMARCRRGNKEVKMISAVKVTLGNQCKICCFTLRLYLALY